jgi:hypothetical protein
MKSAATDAQSASVLQLNPRPAFIAVVFGFSQHGAGEHAALQ